jgi:hypothetical protein
MALIHSSTITADGTTTINLQNYRGVRNTYSVYLSDDFGGGTVTALLLSPRTGAVAIPIPDASGVDVSLTDNGVFNFEAQSGGSQNPVKLQIILTGASDPSIKLDVCNGK